jgi:ubiquinone/menaquinone biosynthesis C-methylase UbiE
VASDIEREAARVRDVYARRAAQGLDARYSYWRAANLFIYQTRERDFLRLLRDASLLPLTGRRVLDAGCGDGGILRDLLRYSASASDLTGVDLLAERVEQARELTPGARIEQADAQSLPFDDGSFDLVLGFTLLSSVLEDEARQRIATEMQRVLAPGGLIVLYDFWTNPLNRHARPLRRDDVRALFPRASLRFYRTTLAPPLVRLLAPLPAGWLACNLLEVLPFARTHYLVAIRPGQP